jgi:23S rRNA G2069 N7-methylase RlmK/C1962 C5-methylase RlmI
MRRSTPWRNARANGLEGRVCAVCCDLLAALKPGPRFDVILSSPPKHAGEPRNLADLGWHAGPKYRHIAALFDHARAHLAPGGVMYVMVSSDSDLDLLGTLVERAGFTARQVHEHSLYIESMIIYELSVH